MVMITSHAHHSEHARAIIIIIIRVSYQFTKQEATINFCNTTSNYNKERQRRFWFGPGNFEGEDLHFPFFTFSSGDHPAKYYCQKLLWGNKWWFGSSIHMWFSVIQLNSFLYLMAFTPSPPPKNNIMYVALVVRPTMILWLKFFCNIAQKRY